MNAAVNRVAVVLIAGTFIDVATARKQDAACFGTMDEAAFEVRGRWVVKASSHSNSPPYGPGKRCPLEWSKYACLAGGCHANYTFHVTSCNDGDQAALVSFDPARFLAALVGRTVAFIGDSLTRQQFISQVCHLLPFAEPPMDRQVIPWVTQWDWPCGEGMCGAVKRGPHSGFDTPFCLTFQRNVTLCLGETLLQLPDRRERMQNWAAALASRGHSLTAAATANVAPAQNVTSVHGRKTHPPPPGLFALHHLKALPDLLVVNEWGLHHNTAKDHEEGVNSVVRFARDNGYYPYGTQRLLLYRETSPQAFPGPTGDYFAFKVAEKRRKKREWRTGISFGGGGKRPAADFDSDFPDEARRARARARTEADKTPRRAPPVCRDPHFPPWVANGTVGAAAAAPGPPPATPRSWWGTMGAWLGLEPAPTPPSRGLSPPRSDLRSYLFGPHGAPHYTPDPAHPALTHAAVPPWLIGHRQAVERAVLRAAGVPLLHVFDLSVSLPCRGLGTIGYPDCTHYCLPGVPDAWTALLYAFVTHTPFFDPAYARGAARSQGPARTDAAHSYTPAPSK